MSHLFDHTDHSLYSNGMTFLRQPMVQNITAIDADVVVLGLPFDLATMTKGTKKFLKCVLASLSQSRFIISMIHKKMPDLLFGNHVYKDKKILTILHINIVIISKYALKHLASLFQDYSSQ